jgi:hypothetical protein
VDRYVPLHYTLAQKSAPGQFHAGQVIVFHAETPGVRRHEALEIVRVDPHQLVARTQGGQEHVVAGNEARAFDVYERRPIEIAPHHRLLLTANREESGLRVTNGEMVTVSQVDEQGRVHLEDGQPGHAPRVPYDTVREIAVQSGGAPAALSPPVDRAACASPGNFGPHLRDRLIGADDPT